MTKDAELESLAKLFLKTSKKCLKHDGYLSPMVIARKRGMAIIYSLPHNKNTWLSFVMNMLRSLGADSYFVYEAWVFPLDLMVDALPPSENPGRTEEVLVHGYQRSGGRILLSQRFVHDPDGIGFLGRVNVSRNSVSLRLPEKW